ncbi:tetratricopeptide repeat protein [Cyanobacterium aponinum]|uniref:Tetratricopeptide repeat protein n=1 Tax=Cyanobacterium aponinum 0216 TaxID=2676140 RepID=A0A844H324_9CHRO|nr:tetratricopeptide repeat protein [Cyanobacterium aponinum]MTF40735.1 tetratricopeptide repeat protein [Cyanobacterium aponinum 0216]
MLKLKSCIGFCCKLIVVISLPYLIFNLLLYLYTFGWYYFLFIKNTWVIINKPNDIWAYYNRAVVRRQYGDHKGAIYDFTQSIRVRSATPKTLVRAASPYHKRGQEYYLLGYKQKALKDYKKAIEIYKQQQDTQSYEQIINIIEEKIQQIEKGSTNMNN